VLVIDREVAYHEDHFVGFGNGAKAKPREFKRVRESSREFKRERREGGRCGEMRGRDGLFGEKIWYNME
jgi:hypothetical protein